MKTELPQSAENRRANVSVWLAFALMIAFIICAAWVAATGSGYRGIHSQLMLFLAAAALCATGVAAVRTRKLFAVVEAQNADLSAAKTKLEEECRERARIQRSLALFEAAVKNSPSPTIITDAELDLPGPRIVYANQAFASLSGYSVEEVLGKTPRILHGPKTERATSKRLRKALSEGGSFSGEITNHAKDGREFIVEMLIAPIRDASGKITHFVGLQCDITAQRIAERDLRASEERFRHIAENASDFISVIDTRGRFLYVSPSSARLGYEPRQLIGASLFDLIHPEDLESITEALERTVQTSLPGEVEHRTRHSDGSWRSLESVGTAVHDSSGEIEHIVVVSRDISERRAAEAKHKQLEIQLRHAQKMESIGHLAAGIAHEINTPTQYIRNNVLFLKTAFTDLNALVESHHDLIRKIKADMRANKQVADVIGTAPKVNVDYLITEIPSAIQQSLEGIERVTKIVRAMREFSHPGSNNKVPADLNKLIDNTLTVCRNEWKFVADVVSDFDPTLPLVPCLAGEINQTILNIVVNASHAIADVVGDASHGKGTITVSTKRDGDWAEIRISDTGTGIPEHARNHVFDPFFTTKEVGKGTGQGLAIAHTIVVEKHGGSIIFETGTGRGTTFIIRLPLNTSMNDKDKQS